MRTSHPIQHLPLPNWVSQNGTKPGQKAVIVRTAGQKQRLQKGPHPAWQNPRAAANQLFRRLLDRQASLTGAKHWVPQPRLRLQRAKQLALTVWMRTACFGAESGDHGSHSAVNGHSSSASGHSNTGRQSSQDTSSSSNRNTDLALSPTRASAARLALHEEFARTYLAKEGFSHNVICNVLDRLELFKNSGSGESPDEACVRIFSELRIPVVIDH